MVNMKRKLVYVVIMLFMASTVLAACSGGNTAADKPKEETSAPSNNTTTTSTEKSEDNHHYIVDPKENFKVTVLRPEHPSQPLRADAPSLLEIKRKTGITIDLTSAPLSDFDVKKRTLLSTNRLTDVMWTDISDIREFADAGIFLDLTPYWESGKLPNLRKALENHPDYKKILVNGKLYGFPNLDREEMYYGQQPMIRTDILKELNLPIPTSFDELHTTLKKMKEAYPDSYTWTMRWGIKSQLGYLGYAFGSGYDFYYEPKTDKYQFGPLYPEFKDLIVYLKKMYDDKLLDPNYATNTAQQWQQNLSSGKSLFYYDNNMFGVNFIGALQKTDPEAMIDMIPVLKNKNGDRRGYRYPSGHIGAFYAISSKVKNPDKVIELFDWFYSEEGADITNYGIPGEHFTRTKDGIQINQELMDRFKDKAEPAWAYLSYLGTNFQGFGPYSDQTVFERLDPQMTEWGKLVKKQADEGIIRQYMMTPPFNDEETEILKELKTNVTSIAEQNFDRFIMGDRPMSEWDDFVQELVDAGAKQVEKIYNDAYDRVR